jgi:hypothetical protein
LPRTAYEFPRRDPTEASHISRFFLKLRFEAKRTAAPTVLVDVNGGFAGHEASKNFYDTTLLMRSVPQVFPKVWSYPAKRIQGLQSCGFGNDVLSCKIMTLHVT